MCPIMFREFLISILGPLKAGLEYCASDDARAKAWQAIGALEYELGLRDPKTAEEETT